MPAPDLIADLALLLLTASVTGVLCRALKQPAVLGYLVAGLIVGPYLPLPVFANSEHARSLADLGVVLVMFVVGLDLRLQRVVAVLPTAGATALLQVAVVVGAGFGLGLAVGLTHSGALFLGAALSISSTMVVSKVYDEQRVARDVRDFVMSVLVLQDVVAIVLVATLSAVAAGQALSSTGVAAIVGRLLALLVAATVAGLLLVPPFIRRVVRARNRELLVVVCAGLCFGFALFAKQLGYSVALGAFLAGMLVAESGEGRRIEALLRPLRDLFGAIFFVAVGMTVNPGLVWVHLGTSLLAFALVIVAPIVSVSVSGVLLGNGLRRSVTAGLSLGQVGEFGFIIAAIARRGEPASAGLDSIIVTVAVLSAFTTPIAVRHADAMVRAIEQALPARVRSLLELYESWFKALRAPSRGGLGPSLRRTALVIGLDGLATSAVLVGAQHFESELLGLIAGPLGLHAPWDHVALRVGIGLLATLPGVSFLRATRLLGRQVAELALGPDSEPVGAQLLVASVQLAVLLGVGVPCAVLVLPFAGPRVMASLAVVVAVLLVVIWRSAGAYTHARHSAERLMDFVVERTADDAGRARSEPADALAFTHTVALTSNAYAVGKTLAELDLRATTGATAVALRSIHTAYRVPTGHESLRSGDIIAIAGSGAALEDARSLLEQGPPAIREARRLLGSESGKRSPP